MALTLYTYIQNRHFTCNLEVAVTHGACRFFLAPRISTYEILPWDRNSYLTHVILHRLSREDCTLAVLELTRMVVN